jgi:hypothetical protein
MQVARLNKKSIRAFAIEMKNIYYSFMPTDDSRFSITQIEEFVKRETSAVIKEKVERNKFLGLDSDDTLFETFACLKLEDSTDYSCKCTENGGSFKVVNLPKMLYVNGSPEINYIGLSDFSEDFSPVSSIAQANKQSSGTIGLKTKPMYWISKDKAYIILPKNYSMVCDITIVAIPQSQEEAAVSSGGSPCSFSEAWSVPDDVKSMVQDRVMGKLLPTIYNMRPNKDYRNNNNDMAQLASTYKQSNQV